ncbi:hypothetical protein CEXT_178471 [Caerostris extrusa]|uniref:Uncharacterized protein n=1 Tax=Caerostris extrusa TaxID=172846 RepID=A0AAV4UFI3_CAEEX|nr:hypothetical protein CEXT_178471 [Caerostris extrusa]
MTNYLPLSRDNLFGAIPPPPPCSHGSPRRLLPNGFFFHILPVHSSSFPAEISPHLGSRPRLRKELGGGPCLTSVPRELRPCTISISEECVRWSAGLLISLPTSSPSTPGPAYQQAPRTSCRMQ